MGCIIVVTNSSLVPCKKKQKTNFVWWHMPVSFFQHFEFCVLQVQKDHKVTVNIQRIILAWTVSTH